MLVALRNLVGSLVITEVPDGFTKYRMRHNKQTGLAVIHREGGGRVMGLRQMCS